MRVVSESERPAALQNYHSFARTLRYELGAVREYRNSHASVPAGSVTLGDGTKLSYELRVVVSIRRVLAGVSGRTHPRSTVEGIDLDARVVRDRGETSLGGDNSGLGERIVEKRTERLVEGKRGSDVIESDQIQIRQEDRDLLGLVTVTRCEDRFQPASAFS